MNVLILGYSKIAQKRILPALKGIPSIDGIDIASKSSASEVALNMKGSVFDDYQTALSKTDADIVYVSLVNSIHAEWVERSLRAGLHVIVDKPAFMTVADSEKLVALAREKSLCLAESTVYPFHPQIQLIHDVFRDAGSRPTRLTGTFCFPPLDSGDYRYVENLGGGALWDLGPYAITPGRVFFNEKPEEIFCRVCTRYPKSNVDTSFSILAYYSEGRSMVGHFGFFDTQYCNHMTLLGPNISIDLDYLFTTQPDRENEMKIQQGYSSRALKISSADTFCIFIKEVIDRIQSGNYELFYQVLLEDAIVLDRFRIAAHEV